MPSHTHVRMVMRIRCRLGIHKWHRMPWMRTRDFSPKPDHACLECGRIKYDWVLYVKSIEGPGLWSNLSPQYEGQTPPEGYDSWQEYRTKVRASHQKFLNDSL